MATENCGACGRTVPFSATVHVLVHTRGDEGVVDHYVCTDCYEETLAPMFERGDAPSTGPADAGE